MKEKLGEGKARPGVRGVHGRGKGGKSKEEPQVLSEPGGQQAANKYSGMLIGTSMNYLSWFFGTGQLKTFRLKSTGLGRTIHFHAWGL